MFGATRLVTLAIVAGCLLAGAANARELPKQNNQLNGNGFDIANVDVVDESNDLLLNYNPIEPKRADYKTLSRNADGKLKASSYVDGERESTERRSQEPAVWAVMSEGESGEPKASENVDRVKDIALNSREIRLIGPNQKEVEMRDDVASKIVVAMDNLQKEAKDVWGQVNDKLDKGWTDLKRSEVWGQVNDKLDKGWTDLKTMVEGVVSPSSKQQAERKQN